MCNQAFCQVKKVIKENIKMYEKSIDILKIICYNIGVVWRDGRVGLRRTTGNRVTPNTVSRVRIPFSPPKNTAEMIHFLQYFFIQVVDLVYNLTDK